jgi:hypothetical protein
MKIAAQPLLLFSVWSLALLAKMRATIRHLTNIEISFLFTYMLITHNTPVLDALRHGASYFIILEMSDYLIHG